MIFSNYGRCSASTARVPNGKPNVRHCGQPIRRTCSNASMTRSEPNWSKASSSITILEENARSPRPQTLSYADYYARYHTTEPRDGWQMANPTGQKVVYVRG